MNWCAQSLDRVCSLRALIDSESANAFDDFSQQSSTSICACENPFKKVVLIPNTYGSNKARSRIGRFDTGLSLQRSEFEGNLEKLRAVYRPVVARFLKERLRCDFLTTKNI